jgi:hypothetical protein
LHPVGPVARIAVKEELTMRYATTFILTLTGLLTLSGSAGATTSARACRTACAPRITEQCSGRTGRALRQCRRPLLRACRATTPDIGCPSTQDLARALGDRFLAFSPDSFVLLCADGSFAETPPQGGRPGSSPITAPVPTPIVSPGPWLVVVEGDGLAVDLGLGRGRESQLSVTPTLAGFVVDGTLVADADATAACAAQPPPASSPSSPDQPTPPPTSSSPGQPPATGGTPVLHVPRLPQVPQPPELPPR